MVYRIYCKNCSPSVRFNPSTDTFQQTFITMENLSPGTAYRVEMYSENGVSSVAREAPRSADILVTTEVANPSMVTALYVKSVRPDSIELGWRPPLDLRTITTSNEEIIVNSLAEKTEYGFQMCAKRVGGGWGEWTTAMYQQTGSSLNPVYMGGNGEGTSTDISAIIRVIIAVIILLFVISVIVTVYWRRGRHNAMDGLRSSPQDLH